MSRIVVTAAGGSGGRFLTEALRAAGHYVIGTDCDPYNLPLSVADEKHLVPRPGADYAAALGKLCEDLRPDLLMPQSDAEVAALSGRPAEVADHVALFLPEPETIQAAQDKWQSYLRWKDAGVPCAETWSGSCLDLVPLAPVIDELWLGRRTGAGGAGTLRTRSRSLAEKWLTFHLGENSLIHEYLEGINYVADLVYWYGECVAWAGRSVLSWQMANCSPSGVTGASKVTVFCASGCLAEAAQAAVEALPGTPHGVFGVDTIRKPDGSYWVTEVNAGRFNAPGPAFYMRSGLNLAAIAAALGTGQGEVGCAEGALSCPRRDAHVMLRGQDCQPVYLARAEWEALRCE